MVMHSDVDIFVGELLEDVSVLKKRCTRLESVLERLITNMLWNEKGDLEKLREELYTTITNTSID